MPKEEIEQLQEQLKALEAKSELKDQFFASIAHELRTPMNAVIGLSQILLKSDLSAKQREYISKIESSGTILVELVNDILDFSKIEAGKLSIEDTVFDLNDVLDNVSQILAIKAQEKGNELIFNFENKINSVLRGDPLRLGQVIINLMGNAIKFTDRGEVSLSIKALDDSTVEFHVKDTGIGLNQEQMDRLFQNFSQATVSTSRKYGGSGLGPTISKQLINLMGGEIHVESEYGKGSEFIFTISTTFAEDKRLYHLPSKDLVGKKVLLIDKNQTTLDALMNILNYFKYDSTIVDTVEEAERFIEQESFDIIFVEIKMIKSFKEGLSIHNPDAKVVVLNGVIELNDQGSINGFGIDAYLFKPFNLHKVFEIILKAYQREIVSLAEQESKLTKRDLVRLKGSHIALAEDNKINQMVITAMLEDTEIEVSLFDNGKELLDYMESENRAIDLILMDVNMPIMDGYETTIAIKKTNRYNEIPIIALTASQAKKDIDRALEVGMVEYLSQPIYMHLLYGTLKKYIVPKMERSMPKVEDLILFNAKFNASIRKFEELFQNEKSEDMVKLIIKMEKEANRVDIDTLNGMSDTVQDIVHTRQKELDSFLFEYKEVSQTFFDAYDVVTDEAFENAKEEERKYALKVLSLQEGVDAMNGDEALYYQYLNSFYTQFKDSLNRIKYNIQDKHKLRLFANELHNEAHKINAKVMMGLSESLMQILNREQEELKTFIEKYPYAFDAKSYQD